MDLFTYLMAKKGHNTHRDLFSYLLGKKASGGSGTYTTFSGTSLNISNTLRARIKNITLKGATSQDGTPTPETPIPIKVVSGDNTINICGKNLFDKTSNIVLNKYIGGDGTIQNEALNWYQEDYIEVKPSTNYIMSSNSNQTVRIALYDENKTFISRFYSIGNIQATTTATTKYIRLSGYNNINDNIMLNVGTTALPYEPYQSQTYPINLGSIELAKIGDYQDYIYGTPNNWYKKSAITKIKLSDLTWRLQSYGFQTIVNLSNIVKPATTNTMAILLCNVYRACTPNNAYGLTGSLEHGISVYDNAILVRETIIRDLNDFNTMISSANVYLLNIEPTDTPITDTTLIEQLNNLYNATSQEGTTYITCSSASDSNEIIVFSGDIKVTSVGNSLNTSLLSSNIQEEANIDDIQEEPTLDDVNEIEEPIEEEVS